MHNTEWGQSIRRQAHILIDDLESLGVRITEEEANRLLFLAQRKYDRYDLFSPGETFLSRLTQWLMNFIEKDRPAAMEIVYSLKFISQYEMKELAIATFERIRKLLLKDVLDRPSENWSVYVDSREQEINEELSKSIFVACADDILFDNLRRYAMQQVDLFKKDNFVEYYKIDKKCREDLPEYKRVFLIDQLSGSGTTAIRKENSKWKGKLPTFLEVWGEDVKNCEVYYSPYLQSQVSKRHLENHVPKWLKEIDLKLQLQVCPTCEVLVSPCLSSDQGVTIDENTAVAKLCREDRYLSKFIPNIHIEKGGPKYCYGFGEAGLTLILQANCPNNTVPLIWHSCNEWFPLFPRVEHHR